MSKQPSEMLGHLFSALKHLECCRMDLDGAIRSIAIETAEIAVRFMEAHQPMDEHDLLERIADRVMHSLLVEAVDADGVTVVPSSGRARSSSVMTKAWVARRRLTPSAM